MELDLNTFSSKELDTLITQAKRRKSVLRKRKSLAVVRERMAEFAAAEGYSLGELFPSAAPAVATPVAATKRTTKRGAKRATTAKTATAAKPAAKRTRSPNAGRKVEPKYRNPANPSETWTGRGKPPRWLATELAGGKTREDFLI